MREPIILEADDGFHFIATRSFAEISLEAIDIESGIYTVYDADGFKLDLATSANGAGIITRPADPVDSREYLVPRLREFLADVGVSESEVRDAAFPALVEVGAERFLEREPEPIRTRLWAALRALFGPKRAA